MVSRPPDGDRSREQRSGHLVAVAGGEADAVVGVEPDDRDPCQVGDRHVVGRDPERRSRRVLPDNALVLAKGVADADRRDLLVAQVAGVERVAGHGGVADEGGDHCAERDEWHAEHQS